MAKIFVSYKYGDTSVLPLEHFDIFGVPTTSLQSTVRDYVDVLQSHLDEYDHINKGEDDGEDLSTFKEETIESKLRDRIYDSSVTIVMISKNMIDRTLPENDQWIPWEIAYSLREKTRDDRVSRTNAVLAVVLPDENGGYDYFVENTHCPDCNSIYWKTKSLFSILHNNMFNRRQPKRRLCENGTCESIPHVGDDHSYIYPVRWDVFLQDINHHIGVAKRINSVIHEYKLVKIP